MSFTIKTLRTKKVDEECTVAVHSSGLKVYLSTKESFTNNYAVFGTHYGSIDTEFAVNGGEMISVPEGIAHFLEHKLFEGEDGDAFTKYAVTGASANAYTSFDRTCYLFSCSGKFYENLDILLSFVSSPYFTPETVQKEQGIIGQEIRMYEDVAGWRVLFNLLRAMYHNHPVNIEIAGTKESIAKITDKTLYDCYKTFYNPSNMFVCICGNFEIQKVLDMIDEKIEDKGKTEIIRSTHSEPDTIVNAYIEEKMEVSMPLFVAGIKDTEWTIKRTSKNIETANLLLELVAGKTSPLYNELLSEGLINNNFSTEYFYGNGYSALLFEGESNNAKLVQDRILSAIEEIKQNGADESLFGDLKRKLYGKKIRAYSDAEGSVDEMIGCIMEDFEPFESLTALESVSLEDIKALANQLKSENFALSVILPAKN